MKDKNMKDKNMKDKNMKDKNMKDKNMKDIQVKKRSLQMRELNSVQWVSSWLTFLQTNIYAPTIINSQKMHHMLTVDNSDNLFTVNKVNDLDYEVGILKRILIEHDVDSSDEYGERKYNWKGKIKVFIDTNWKITLTFETSDGWSQNNQWIYGRLWFCSGYDEIESVEKVSGDEYEEFFTNPNSNERGQRGPVKKLRKLKAFRRDYGSNVVNVDVSIQPPRLDQPNLKIFTDNRNPHYLIETGGDEIYILRYQARLEGYYKGFRQVSPNMSIDISGDLKVKLPGFSKGNNGYKTIRYNTSVPGFRGYDD